jgi:hypothetical protein
MILALLWMGTLISSGQTSGRDYAITAIDYSFSEDQRQFLITVSILNQGAKAEREADLVVALLTGNQRELGRQTFAALDEGISTTFSLVFTVADFPPATEQVIEVAVGLDEFEPEGSAVAADNRRSVTVAIPERVFSWSDLLPVLAFEGETVTILGYRFSREQFAIGAAVTVAALLFLWLFTVVLRLIFRRPARFPQWQPPYAALPMVDQHSLEGRRQAWQQHAQHNLLLAAAVAGNLHPIKALLDKEGRNLGLWKCSAMRLTQYDSYGRISRSQAIAARKVVKRFNTILRKRHSLNEAALRKELNSVAHVLVKAFGKTMLRKNTFLPVAFDLRWEGKQGEVHIVFELYQCQQSAWHRIDHWEPVMALISPTVQENFSFTIHGMAGGEKVNDYLKRLREDVVWLLSEMLREIPATTPAQEAVRHEVYDIPDTLTGMEPMRDEAS